MDKPPNTSAFAVRLLHAEGTELTYEVKPGQTWADAARFLAECGYVSIERDGRWQALTAEAA